MKRTRMEETSGACRRVRGQIQALADGSLDPGLARSAEAHCGTCRSCGALLTEARAIWSVLAEDPHPVLTVRLWPGVHAGLRHPPRPLSARISWAGASAFAAAVGLAIGILVAPETTATAEVWEQATWGEVGSLLADGSGLDQIYLDVSTEAADREALP